MRQAITIIGVIALLLYVGWVLDYHERQAGAPPVHPQARSRGIM